MKIDKEVSNIKSSWYVWLFPFFAVALCAWLLFQHMSEQGPKIKIFFEDGASLQSEKTQIRHRGVVIGTLKKVEISEDGKKVVAYASLAKSAEHFAVKGSKFWIVSPKVSFQGISGLETLIEGSYIAAQPGPDEAESENEFNGKAESESNDPLENTASYILESGNIESINAGDSVTFRGLKIGSVTRVNLSKTSQTVLVHINIENKFVKVIRTNSVFWRKQAVKADIGLFNSKISVGSLDTILRGGIDVFTPDNAGEIAKAQTKFALSDGPPKGWEKWNPVLDFK